MNRVINRQNEFIEHSELRNSGEGLKSSPHPSLSWITGGSTGSTQLSPGRVSLRSLLPESAPHPGKELFPRPTGEGRVRGLSAFDNVILRTQSEESFAMTEGNLCSPTKMKFAFTLAEVLITLGVIGVVAAMTIPGLITEHQKRTTVTKLQRAISVLNQAYRLAYDDVGEATAQEAMDLGSEKYFNTYWAPYLKKAHLCKTYQDCGFESNTPYKYINGTNNTTAIIWKGHRTAFYTLDGFFYIIFTAGGEQTNYRAIDTVSVDINGGSKPNKVGKDVFYLTRVVEDEKSGVVLPDCYNSSDTAVNNDCSKSSTGICCAEKIRRAGWKIDKSYPW